MIDRSTIDGVLIQWGDRLFYPGNRMVKTPPQPGLDRSLGRQRADAIRARLEATAVRRAPQVMVKVTGGGRGIKAIAAHFRYISKNGRLDIEDENGTGLRGKDAIRELVEDWRFGGTPIETDGHRREAFNIILSMPRGRAEPLVVLNAAREFARAELAGHKYVMLLHEHQAHPHVHLSVRAESKQGRRLNPRKADLHRWRETFAEKLRGWGIDAEATRQSARGRYQGSEPLWRLKAREDGRLRTERPTAAPGTRAQASQAEALRAWMQIGKALAASGDPGNQRLAASIKQFIQDMPDATNPGGQGASAHPDRSPARSDITRTRDVARNPGR
ncbi:MAG: conjugal transfer protein TraS [Piscinibacter sp.]|uniref:relaxase/mobilization nuclease domain-containing protein n=1 Tax=Piscinibacter sp. TaxID=1903157 RepID=UPI002589999A|nr:conjugal transfer protein TraS [Piscinibacter sp.]MCW5662815.1 conjugal transfer protein TraS [Piscinibacter sp.]